MADVWNKLEKDLMNGEHQIYLEMDQYLHRKTLQGFYISSFEHIDARLLHEHTLKKNNCHYFDTRDFRNDHHLFKKIQGCLIKEYKRQDIVLPEITKPLTLPELGDTSSENSSKDEKNSKVSSPEASDTDISDEASDTDISDEASDCSDIEDNDGITSTSSAEKLSKVSLPDCKHKVDNDEFLINIITLDISTPSLYCLFTKGGRSSKKWIDFSLAVTLEPKAILKQFIRRVYLFRHDRFKILEQQLDARDYEEDRLLRRSHEDSGHSSNRYKLKVSKDGTCPWTKKIGHCPYLGEKFEQLENYSRLEKKYIHRLLCPNSSFGNLPPRVSYKHRLPLVILIPFSYKRIREEALLEVKKKMGGQVNKAKVNFDRGPYRETYCALVSKHEPNIIDQHPVGVLIDNAHALEHSIECISELFAAHETFYLIINVPSRQRNIYLSYFNIDGDRLLTFPLKPVSWITSILEFRQFVKMGLVDSVIDYGIINTLRLLSKNPVIDDNFHVAKLFKTNRDESSISEIIINCDSNDQLPSLHRSIIRYLREQTAKLEPFRGVDLLQLHNRYMRIKRGSLSILDISKKFAIVDNVACVSLNNLMEALNDLIRLSIIIINPRKLVIGSYIHINRSLLYVSRLNKKHEWQKMGCHYEAEVSRQADVNSRVFLARHNDKYSDSKAALKDIDRPLDIEAIIHYSIASCKKDDD